MTRVTRRTPTCATCRIEHTCTLSLVFLVWSLITLHMAQGRSHLSFTPSPYHPWCAVVFEFLHFTFYFSLLFSFLFLSFFLMSDYDDDSVTNNLRNSANGTFVTLDDFSPLTRTPPHGDGSMYSQANVRAGKVLRSPIRALSSVIVDTEKVLREADGPTKARGPEASNAHMGGKVIAPGCASTAGEPVRSPRIIGAGQSSFLRPGPEKKLYSTHEYSPQGEFDKIAEQMMLTFAESKHPVFRSASPLSRGVLKSKGGGK